MGRRCQPGYCPNVPLYYYGGKVQTEPAVHVIFWGRNWNTEPGLQQRKELMAFFESLSNSPWQGILTQYFQINEGKPGYISHHVNVESFVDEREAAPGEIAGNQVSGKHIEEEVHYAITHQPAEHPWTRGVNSQFTVIPAPGTKYEEGFSEGFCAYHGYVTEEGATSTFQFDPYDGEEPFYHQCIGYDEHGIAGHVTSMLASHEYGETATDPELNGWLDTFLFEIGDICSIVPGTNEVDGGWVQGLWDDHERACKLEDNAPPHVFAVTESPKSSSKHEATVQALLNPEALETHYYFQYGPTSSYEGPESGSTAPVSAGSGTAFTSVSQKLSGLRLEATYHYRVVATNSSGTTYGEDRAVTTSAWNTTTAPLPEGATSGVLSDVSCPSSSWCMALGGSSLGTPFAENWKSGTWSQQGVPLPGGKPETLNNIHDVAIDPSNNVWLTDDGHDRLVELSSKRELLKQVGGEGTGNGQFKDPWGIARSPKTGNLWVADYENSRVQELTPTGEFILAIGWGVEDGGAKAEVCHSTSVCRAGVPGEGPGQFEHPQGITVDKNGNVWVTDPASGRLEGFNEEGNYVAQIGSLGRPAGVAADGEANVWVTEESANRVTEFSSSRAFVRTFGWGVADGVQKLETCTTSLAGCHTGIEGTGKGQFAKVDDVTVDEGGHLWVINDQWYQPTQEFKPEGLSGEVKYVVSCCGRYFPEAIEAAGNALYTSDPQFPLMKWALPTAEGKELTLVAKFVEPIGPALNGISCVSPTTCMAVGEGDPRSFEGSAPLAESWDGTKWTAQTLPAGGSGERYRLRDVSCWSSSECMAVGVMTGIEGSRPFSELWKGGSWTLESAPLPEGYVGSDLRGVSCTSATFCLAVGQRVTTEVESAYGERWNGTSWSLVTVSTSGNFPFGNKFSWLESVSCTSTTWCMGVGNESFGGSEGWQGVGARWNGSELVLIRIPTERQNDLVRISCLAAENCIASGNHELGLGSLEWGSLIEVLNGGTWYNQPAAIESSGSAVQGVSCVLAAQCIAVGGSSGQPLALERPPLPTPGATTGPATPISWDAATLTGTVTPNNWQSLYYFEFGTTTSYGLKIPVPAASVKSETAAEEVREQVSGLVPNKTYHYRLVADNTGNITAGEDKTFTTTAATLSPTFMTAFGSQGSGAGQLSGSQGDAVDSNGNVWVSDAANNRVDEFSPIGEFKLAFGWGVKDGKAEEEVCSSGESCHAGIAGPGPGQLSEPAGIATEGGTVWVAEHANNRVEEFSSAGVYLKKEIGGGPTGAFPIYPNGVALDGHGDMFVTGSSFGSLQKYSIATGEQVAPQYLTYINGYIGQYGVTVDNQGNVWVADGNRVREFSSNLEFKLAVGWGINDGEAKFETCTSECKLGIAGSSEGQFNNPSYVNADTNGDVWVVDSGNNRVQEFSPRGEYITRFGSAGSGPGQFSSPKGIAIANGVAYIADSGNSRVEKWNLSAPANIAAFGSLGSGNGQLSGPQGEVVDLHGNVWVSDSANNRVDEFSPAGQFRLTFGWGVKDAKAQAETCSSSESCRAGIAGSGPGQLSEPAGIATEGGHLWVVDRRNNRVEEFGLDGGFRNKQIAIGSAQYPISPNGVALDGHGDMYVTGSNFGSLQKYSIETGQQVAPQVLTWVNGYVAQYGVTVDHEGNVWVADGNRVREYSSNLEFELAVGWGVKDGEAKLETCISSECKIGIAGSGEGEFNSSGYLTIDAAGNIWVADQGNNRVQELSASGQYITQFGSAGSGAGQFSSPQGIVVSGGLAYAVDSGNNRVQKWGVLE